MLEGGSVCPKDTFEEGIMPGAHLVFPGSLDRKGSLMGWGPAWLLSPRDTVSPGLKVAQSL